tara:strand:+ start:1020 stop:1670 length:651 start_codon:yes stop_codon:yes gene_type:complete
MKINKEYRKGGFFTNSQDKFSDMEGAGSGINTAFGNQGFLRTKGSALRKEKRYLKKLERQGKLNEEGPRSADRLEYLKKLQRDRIKKGAGAAALAAGAVLAAPAVAGALGGGATVAAPTAATASTGAGTSGLAGAATKATLGDKILKALKIGKAGKDLFTPVQPTPEQEADLMEGVDEAGMFGEFGMRVLKKGQKKRDKNKEAMLIRALLGAKLQA